MQHSTLNVQGMTCGHCVRTVETALRALAGVKAVKVDLQGARAAVDFEPNETTTAALVAALTDAGYEASAE